MSEIARPLTRVWKSAQLYIGFHRDKSGRQRDAARVWPPKNANATIHGDPTDQEAFLVVKSAAPQASGDIQLKLRPDRLILRRDPGHGWEGVVMTDHGVSVRVGDIWITVAHDGSVSREDAVGTTYVEADGSILKKTEFVEAMISGDGEELTSRTANRLTAIRGDGIICKDR